MTDQDTLGQTLPSRSLIIIHASVTGTSIDCAERLARRGRQRNWACIVKRVQEFNQLDLLDAHLIVFVLPTTGNGAPPPTFVPLWTSLLHPQLPSDLLDHLHYAVFALGDSSYGKYNWVGKKMSRRLDALGAHAVIERGEGDDQNELGVESTFPQWADAFYQAIEPLAPADSSLDMSRISLTGMPPARIRLRRVDVPLSDAPTFKPKPQPPPAWEDDVRCATVRENRRVTAAGWWQDVRNFELDIEDLQDLGDGERLYAAGDVLEIRPQNKEEDVEDFLKSTGWIDIADDHFEIEPSNPLQPLPTNIPTPFRTTLRHLITHELDISAVPRISFLETLASFSSGDLAEKLRWFCSPEGQDDLIDYAVRPRRSIAEVMYEFRAAKIPPEYVMDLLPQMRARGFSIASSPREHDGRVSLLVAIVSYKTMLAKPRQGVCTSYISGLKPGDRLQVRFDTSGQLRLPGSRHVASDPQCKLDAPLIMVGPGTGVAPFRALLHERIRVNAKENLLFFGCRSVEKDFYYRQEWEDMVKQGSLVLSVAASRDQEDKIYVQHRIPELAAVVWDYLQRGGFLYVCGSSTQMPKAVKKAILGVFRSEGRLEEREAESLWDKLERKGRIIEETWG